MKTFWVYIFLLASCFPRLIFSGNLNITKVGEWGSGRYQDVFIQGNYAYCSANETGLDIIDIADPSSPKKVGSWSTPDCLACGLYVRDKYAYIVDRRNGLQIIDVSNPSSPVLLGEYITSISALDVHVSGNYAYVSTGAAFSIMTSYGGTLEIIDISNPSSPVLKGHLSLDDGMGTGVYVKNGYAYVTIGTDFDASQDDFGGLKIVDVSNPSSPIPAGEIININWYAARVHVVGNYAYMATGFNFAVIDISDKSNPFLAGSNDNTQGGGVFVDGKYAYAASQDGFCIYDISNPADPVTAGSIEVSTGGIYVSGNYAYVTGDYKGLTIIDVSEPSALSQAGNYDTSIDVDNIFVQGNYAYVLDREDSSMQIIDISTPSSPSRVGKYSPLSLGYSVKNVYAGGDYVYASVYDGLKIICVSDPSQPSLAGNYEVPGALPGSVYVEGNYAYLWATPGLHIIDVSNPSSPTPAGTVDNQGWSWKGNFFVKGNYAYIARAFEGLQIIDVSNPGSPFVAADYTTRYEAGAVYVEGNYAYVAGDNTWLYVIDVSNPGSPSPAGNYETSSIIFDIYVEGDYAYLAHAGNGVLVIDVSDPGSLSAAGSCRTPGEASGLHVKDDYVFTADGQLTVLKVDESGTAVLTVQSSPDTGVDISVTPADYNDKGNGTTDFKRTYNKGEVVTLTAPSTFNGKEFSRWSIDGTGHTDLSVQVTMNSDHTAAAYYAILVPPSIVLSKTDLNFGKTWGGKTPAQTVVIDNAGGGTLNWTAVPSQSWIEVTPTSARGTAVVQVNVTPTGLSAGTYTGTIAVIDDAAENSPQQVTVTLNVYDRGSAPFGSFDTPLDNSVVRSSIPVTGWVLDDIGVESVIIYREEGNSLVYIGDATFVEGARPDVQNLYPGYPENYKAGWGYMMLTNFLPGGGNDTFRIHAAATDLEGNRVTLGIKTIHCDNANAVKPFGAVDTPEEGGTASGNGFVNFGWALTPLPNTIPTDGSTIRVWIDGLPKGNPVYNQYRKDIATLFPGYNNSDGAVGYFYLDTTEYGNGVHTIQWTVSDNAGNTDGIGSRYFIIQNTGGDRVSREQACLFRESIAKIPVDYHKPLYIKKGYNPDTDPIEVYPGGKGDIYIEMEELERLEIRFSNPASKVSPLPTGSFLDSAGGVFYWQLGPGFVGNYRLVFIETGQYGNKTLKNVLVSVKPRCSICSEKK